MSSTNLGKEKVLYTDVLNPNGTAASKNTVNQKDAESAQFEFEVVEGDLDGISDNTLAWVGDSILLGRAAPSMSQ